MNPILRMILTFLIVCLIDDTYSLSIESAQQSGAADDLEYRRLRPEEIGVPSVPADEDPFGAVIDGGGKEENVKGWVYSYLTKNVPQIVLDNIPGKTEQDGVVSIEILEVDEDWQNKGVASKMLPLALKDMRVKWPNVVAVYLRVNRDNAPAIKLYKNNNFTPLGQPDQYGNQYYLYKYKNTFKATYEWRRYTNGGS